MPILGPDGQPANLPRAIGTPTLKSFAPMQQEHLVELRRMVEHALAGGIPPQHTVAIPLATVAQLLVTLEGATAILLAQDGAAPPWLDAVDPDGEIPAPHTTRVTYWQDSTMQIERWHSPEDDGDAHIGTLGHGTTIYGALAAARPLHPPTLLQQGLDREPMEDVICFDCDHRFKGEPNTICPLCGGPSEPGKE